MFPVRTARLPTALHCLLSLFRKVSCGLDYTVVCTHPYAGPDLKVAGKLMEESNLRQQEALLKSRGFD